MGAIFLGAMHILRRPLLDGGGYSNLSAAADAYAAGLIRPPVLVGGNTVPLLQISVRVF